MHPYLLSALALLPIGVVIGSKVRECGWRFSGLENPRTLRFFRGIHYRIHFHPDVTEDGNLEVILRFHDGSWWIKLEDAEEFWLYYDEDDFNGIWTSMDDTNQELFVIRGVVAED